MPERSTKLTVSGGLPTGTYDLADAATWDLFSVSAGFTGNVIYGVRDSTGTSEGAQGTVEILNAARGGQVALLTDVELPLDPEHSAPWKPCDGPVVIETAFMSEGAAIR